ncbi:hypothetical protein D3C87_937300 [compost metagenome]
MQSTATTPDAYIDSLPEDRKEAIAKLRAVITENLPPGFQEVMSYGMIGYVVPHSLYPAGYHCDPKLPLPFLSIASQKNFIAVYHMGIYAMPELLDWFTAQWAVASKRKLDMGKSCIRIKKPEELPYALFGELASKLTPAQWIAAYEQGVKR